MLVRHLVCSCTLSLMLASAPSCESTEAPVPKSNSLSPDRIARIDEFVERERARSRIPGIALAIVQDDRVAHLRGFGSKGNGDPVTVSTPFPIGSLTKSFTAVLVRQLVDAGRVDIDAPVQRYLPWFSVANGDASAQITVRRLLNQTSGLSRDAGMQVVVRAGTASIEALARSVSSVKLTATPGTRFQYSNLNFVLLGALIETVHAQQWSEVMQTQVLQPLDMRNTYTDSVSARQHGMTAVHRFLFGLPLEQQLAFSSGLTPAGGIVSTADDMSKYLLMMLRNGQGPHGALLDAQSAQTMLLPAAPPTHAELLSARFDSRYGEGWFVGPFGAAEDARWHLGNLPSFTAWIILMPSTRSGVVLLMNANCELPFFDASATFSRVPIGIIALMHGQQPPRGNSVTDAYLRLNAVVVCGAAVITLIAVWAATRRSIWISAALAAVAMTSATAVAYTTLGWRGLVQFAPDLVLWFTVMVGVMIAPVGYRLLKSKARRRQATVPTQ